jgi:hypothetical protein
VVTFEAVEDGGIVCYNSHSIILEQSNVTFNTCTNEKLGPLRKQHKLCYRNIKLIML